MAGAHSISVRVYYEDTDFSGVVYHASYLRFMERGRTELIRDLGIEQRELFDGELAERQEQKSGRDSLQQAESGRDGRPGDQKHGRGKRNGHTNRPSIHLDHTERDPDERHHRFVHRFFRGRAGRTDAFLSEQRPEAGHLGANRPVRRNAARGRADGGAGRFLPLGRSGPDASAQPAADSYSPASGTGLFGVRGPVHADGISGYRPDEHEGLDPPLAGPAGGITEAFPSAWGESESFRGEE